jgi:hypothetical protein
MVRHGVDTIVFSSSCATYGVPDVLPIAEEALQRPISPYGHSKLMCEQILLHVATTYHLRISKRQETQQPSSPMLHERSACFISSQNILIWKPSFRRHGDRARSRARAKPADFPELSAQTFVGYAAELEFHVDPGHGAEIIDRIVLITGTLTSSDSVTSFSTLRPTMKSAGRNRRPV